MNLFVYKGKADAAHVRYGHDGMVLTKTQASLLAGLTSSLGLSTLGSCSVCNEG